MTSPLIVVSARMASSRHPGKALAPLLGRPMLRVLLERMRTTGLGVALATSVNAENDALASVAERASVPVFRGDEDDVLRRHLDCARHFSAEHVVRVTGDNPLTDTETLLLLVERHLAEQADYTFVPGDALLMGILSEVVSRAALERSWERGEPRHRSELMTLYIKEHPEEFRIRAVALPAGLYRPSYRLTVDEADDVSFMQALCERLSARGKPLATREAIALLDEEPDLLAINAHLRHKAHNLRSVALDARLAQAASDPAAAGAGR